MQWPGRLGRFAGGSGKEGPHPMNYRNVSAPARPLSRTLAAIARNFAQSAALAGAFAVTTSTVALAQQPPAPGAKPAPTNKPPQQQQQPQPQLIFSPWTKLCRKRNDSPYDAKQVCFTRKDARNESGLLVVAADLIEPEGDTNKNILRVTLPLGLQLISGTRVIIDSNKAMTAPFGICFPDGCLADYDASGGDLIANMKKGHGLTIQAINSTGQPISLTLPLSDFAKAYDGPPTDPKVIEEHQKLQEELQRSADEARKKLDQQQGQPQ
jgi:invasion protein IalB